MFESVKRADWENIEADARAYGRAFAHEFGPSGRRKLVDSVEIGNEPGKWSDADYTRMFKAMAEGVRAGDPKLKIATCNLTTGKSGNYEKSVELRGEVPGVVRRAEHSHLRPTRRLANVAAEFSRGPEAAALSAGRRRRSADGATSTRRASRCGSRNLATTATTKPQEKTGNFAKWVGVTDEQQAQWLVRSLLVFSAMPVERAYIYFFNDEDKPVRPRQLRHHAAFSNRSRPFMRSRICSACWAIFVFNAS